MTDKVETNKLEKFVTGEVEELSPLLQKSNELKASADGIVVNSKENYTAAKLKRRELSAHRTAVKDMRLTYTRKLDDLKGLFIQKEDEILVPVLEAESDLKARILGYEEELRKIKEREENRIQDIIIKLTVERFDRKTVTKDEVVRAEAALKMEAGLLEKKDRNKKVIKEHIAAQRDYLKELREFVVDRDAQAEEARALAEEQTKLAAEREEFEKSKSTQEAIKGSDETSTVTPVAEPNKGSEPTIKEDSPWTLVNDLGSDCMEEATKVLGERLAAIEGQPIQGDEWSVWKQATVDEIYAVIAKYQ